FHRAHSHFPDRMEPCLFQQINIRAAQFIIGLIGRPYILYEPELGGKLFSFFKQEKIFLITPEMISQPMKNKALESLERPIFWYNGRENVGAAFAQFQNRKVDGIIQVVTFGCGPDSLMKELIDLKAASTEGKPYLSLVFDQHTTIAGIQTRLEAFLDMLKRKKKNNIEKM
ncbi:2-hydroxyacyl-CoA dehydratase, partial [candidate division CSSED10-310 bacterium]